MPWWAELKLPGSGAVTDMMWDLESDEKFFPADKFKILKMVSEEDEEVLQGLPERTYHNTDEIAAGLLQHLPPIESQKQPIGLFWKYPAEALAPGQQLLVGKDQVALMVSKSGKPCDEFAEGGYTISQTTCPLLARESRKALPGYSYSVLNGFPLYFSSTFEFEIDLSTLGQTRALRRVMAKGVARVKIASSKKFVEQFGSGKNLSSSQALSAVTKFCSDNVKNTMSQHEMQELSANPSLLEPPLKEALSNAGMDPVRISFGYVGDIGPGMYMPPGQAGNPQSSEQARQMAETIRAAQMARLQAVQEMMQQRQGNVAGATPPGPSMINCPDCHTPNPQGSKFCNNCGKPLSAAKKPCPNCGKLLDPNVKFCGNCGTKL